MMHIALRPFYVRGLNLRYHFIPIAEMYSVLMQASSLPASIEIDEAISRRFLAFSYLAR